MSAKVIIGIVVVAIIAIIVGLIILLQKQPKTATNQESNEKGLEIVGEQGKPLPSDLPSPAPSRSITDVQTGPKRPIEKNMNLTQPEMSIDTNKTYSAILETTAGDITISFTPKEASAISEAGLVDNTIFHRVIAGFMIQGGDPKGDGTGGPGYAFDDEPFTGEYKRGTVAMANSGLDTNGSQFFIMHEDSITLPKNYVIFGTVTDGLDVVDTIASAEVITNQSGEPSQPVNPVEITNVKIVVK